MGQNRSIRVLIVEDEAMFAEALEAALLGEPDLEVVGCATTSAEAQDLCRATTPEVVLMDFGLPDADGARTARRLKEILPSTSVIMLTSLVEDSVLLAAIEAGCSGYITKGQAIADVVAAVRAAEAGEALIAPAMLARLLPRLRRSYRGLGSDLTDREREVLDLLTEGLSNLAIAERLHISLNTVRTHVQNVLNKLGAHSKLEAAAIAAKEGLVRLA